MSKSLDKNMEEILDIAIDDVSTEMTQMIPITKGTQEVSQDAEKDYEYTRGELYRLISQGQEAVQGALEVAQESGHPRAYEVAVNAIKQVSDITDKLVDLQHKMKNLGKEDKKAGPTTVNNTMFIGTTADLQQMLKRGKVEE
jgi:hypothetical protein